MTPEKNRSIKNEVNKAKLKVAKTFLRVGLATSMIFGAPACVPTEAIFTTPTPEVSPLPSDLTKTPEPLSTEAPVELTSVSGMETTINPPTEVATEIPIITLAPEPTVTATETVEVKNDFETINKNIDDYLNGTLDYWGPDREYMFVDKIGGEEVEIGRTFRTYPVIGLNNFDISRTVAVMLGRVDNGEKVYVVLGSEKNDQRLVWLVNLGMADKNEYPQLSKIRLTSLGEKHPLYNANYGGLNLIYPDEMAKRLNDIVNRPVEITVMMGVTNELNSSNCGVLDKKQCDYYYSEYNQVYFSSLSNWLETGENFNEAKNSECVVNRLSEDSLENIKTPNSSEIYLPIIR